MLFPNISNISLFLEQIRAFFYKQHFYKYRKAEIAKKSSKS